ncbi:MAG: hypothetical protein IJT77_08600 [Clostridia bacterium]|nr:hypothetical protein [Clostridia bacterium]
MSWRRFLVLCRNLSPYGAVAVRIRAMEDREIPAETDSPEAALAAEAFFSSVVAI